MADTATLPAPLDWLFRDKVNDRLVVAQRPNVRAMVGLGAIAARTALGRGGRSLSIVEITTLVTAAAWAGDEVARGVNPFRRILGCVVLAVLVALVVHRLRSPRAVVVIADET